MLPRKRRSWSSSRPSAGGRLPCGDDCPVETTLKWQSILALYVLIIGYLCCLQYLWSIFGYLYWQNFNHDIMASRYSLTLLYFDGRLIIYTNAKQERLKMLWVYFFIVEKYRSSNLSFDLLCDVVQSKVMLQSSRPIETVNKAENKEWTRSKL